MDQNPPKLGINWASSLEIAFRSISWLWALEFFKDSPSLNANVYLRLLKFLYLNARHLETYLSTYFSPNTHLTGEALGLFYLGTLLPEFKEADGWRQRGQQILKEQLFRQVRADGVYFEQSSYYHRYTTDFYTHFLILSRLNNEQLPAEVESTLQLLLDHLMHITRPDGTSPLFGDDDGGRLLFLDRRPANDFRAALANGAALFRRGDYKYVASALAEETFWLLGPETVRIFHQVVITSCATVGRRRQTTCYSIVVLMALTIAVTHTPTRWRLKLQRWADRCSSIQGRSLIPDQKNGVTGFAARQRITRWTSTDSRLPFHAAHSLGQQWRSANLSRGSTRDGLPTLKASTTAMKSCRRRPRIIAAFSSSNTITG